MLIDWFTVGAQALNFLILMGLMKRFLYRPILDAIDAREQRIASELADAARKRTEAEHQRDAFRDKNADIDRQRADLLKQATADAADERQRLMDAARASADALASKRQAALAREATSLLQSVEQCAQTEVFAIARQTLAELADARLEASACAVFVARLKALEGSSKDQFSAALQAGEDAAVVRSAFELPLAQRTAIREAIADVFGASPELRYDTEPALVAGIELVAHGQKFAWTISDHLASLQRGVNEVLKARADAR